MGSMYAWMHGETRIRRHCYSSLKRSLSQRRHVFFFFGGVGGRTSDMLASFQHRIKGTVGFYCAEDREKEKDRERWKKEKDIQRAGKNNEVIKKMVRGSKKGK